MVTAEGFSALETARRAGVTYRMLDYWCRCGALGVDLQASLGSGGRRHLSGRDVEMVRLCARLSDLNMPIEAMRAAVDVARPLPRLEGHLAIVGARESHSGWAGRAVLVDDLGAVPAVCVLVDLRAIARESEE